MTYLNLPWTRATRSLKRNPGAGCKSAGHALAMGEPADGALGDFDELLAEQAAYYRARAPVYDDWWAGRGTDPRSDELRASWMD